MEKQNKRIKLPKRYYLIRDANDGILALYKLNLITGKKAITLQKKLKIILDSKEGGTK